MSLRWQRIVRWVLAASVAAGALWQLSLLFRLFWARVRYPADIEWLEGPALYQAYRSAHGLSTFGPPNQGYLPLFHPLGYPAFVGALGRVVGLGYSTGRSVSFVCLLLAFWMVWRAVRKRAADKLDGAALALFAIGVAAAGVPFVGSFYDLVRDDVMALALAIGCALLVSGHKKKLSHRRIAVLALTSTAIVYTRIPAVFFPVWVHLYVMARDRESGIELALTTTSTCGLTLVALQYISKGWYWIYTIGMYQDHGLLRDRFLFALQLLFQFVPFIVALAPLMIGLAVKRRLSAEGALWFGMLVAAIPAGLLPYAKVGGYINDFVPIPILVGAATAALLADLFAALGTWPRVALGLRAALYPAGALFLFARTYDFKPFAPDAALLAKAQKLDAKIGSLEGGVVIPRAPFLPTLMGDKTQQYSDMPYLDVAWANFTDVQLGGYLDRVHAKWAMVSGTEIPLSAGELARRFQFEANLDDTPIQLVGERCQLRYLLKAIDDDSKARVLFDFEGPMDGWTFTGDAFSITTAAPKGQMAIWGIVGQKLANSFHPTKKDPATGTMLSPPFKIDGEHIAMRVGGGTGNLTRVELQIGGRAVRTATGVFHNAEAMVRVAWDVRPFRGLEARIALIDADSGSWGHLIADHFVIY